MLPHKLLTFSNMYTIELILGNKGLDPVIRAAKLANDFAGCAGDILLIPGGRGSRRRGGCVRSETFSWYIFYRSKFHYLQEKVFGEIPHLLTARSLFYNPGFAGRGASGLLHDPPADGFADGFVAGIHVELGQDSGNMVVDGFGGDEEAGADLFVGQPFFQ